MLYLRKSRGEADDLANQRAVLMRLAREDGHPDPQVLTEIGSGETLEKRPIFSRFLAALGTTSQLVLYVTDADRLTRGDLAERGRIYGALQRAGVRIRTPSGWVDLGNIDQRLLAEIKGALAGWELGKYKARVAAVKAEMVRAARPTSGKCPFGYRYNRQAKSIEADPDEFPRLQRLVADAWHMSLRQLAAKHGLTIQRTWNTLKSPTICGYQVRRFRNREPLPRSDWEWSEGRASWAAALSRGEWEELQETLHSRWTGRSKPGQRDDWCRDLLIFEGQGPGKVTLSSSTYAGRERAPTYVWRSNGVRRAYVERSLVHRETEETIQDVLSRPAHWLAAVRQREASQSDGSPDPREQLASLRGRLDRLADEADEADEEERASLHRRREAIRTEIRRWKAKLKARDQKSGIRGQGEEIRLLELLVSTGGSFGEFWNGLEDWQKAKIAGALLERIVITITPTRAGKAHQREVEVVRREMGQAV